MSDPLGAFGQYAKLYRDAGFWPRPVKLGTKAPQGQKWQTPDPDRTLRELEAAIVMHGHLGIGLVTGSPFPDGTKLAVVDIDRNEFVRAGHALLRTAPCGRFGAKGIALFARLRGNGKYRAFKVRSVDGSPDLKLGELLCDRRFCVIPPTTHPDTQQPYRWIGKTLLETDFRELPLIEA